MQSIFVIQDEWHAENLGRFDSEIAALKELHRLAKLPWNEEPNICPCGNWEGCGRLYHIIEFDTSIEPWKQMSDQVWLEVSSKQTAWVNDSSSA